MKIGVYGGTFNPPHLGHAAAARAVVELLKLDRLLIIPAGLPPHKDLPAGSPTPEQRLEMTRLAADQLGLGDRVEVLDVEIHRHGKSYTADTLAALKARYPDDELWLLMGTDMFLTFQAWHEPERILSLAGIAAFGRTEADTEELFSVQRDYLYRTYPQARLFTLTIPGRGGYLLHGAAGKTRPGRRSKLPASGGVWIYPAGGTVQYPGRFKTSAAFPAAAGGAELSEK